MTFNSADSDLEMLQNPIYHSMSFPQFYPRIADSPDFSTEIFSNSQTLPPTFLLTVRCLPPIDYFNSKPTKSFPPYFEFNP